MDPFLFLLTKAALASLQTAYFVALKPAPFCKLSAGLSSTSRSDTSLRLSFCPRHTVSSSVFLFYPKLPCFSLSHFSLLLYYQATMGLRTLISRGATRLTDKLARRGALLVPSAFPYSHSPLISRIHTCLFSDWRRTVLSNCFDTQVPLMSTKELVLHCHIHCVLLFAATGTAFC